MEVTKATKWEEFGGKRCTKGKYDRVYFNINALAGWNSFKKELSNTDQWKLQYAKIFVDLTDDDKYSIEFGSSNRDHYKILDFITNALNEIRAKIEAEKEAEKKALEAKSEEVESKAESNEKAEKTVEPKKCFKAICEERFENGIPLPPFPIPAHKPDWYRKMEKEQKKGSDKVKAKKTDEKSDSAVIRPLLVKEFIKDEIEREYLQSKGREEALAYLDTLADDVSVPKARECCKKILLEFGAKKRRTV